MLRNYFKRPQRFKYDEKRYSSEENENDDEYLFPDISIGVSTVTKIKTNAESTEGLLGIQEKPQKLIDWFPVLSIISAIIISLVAFIVLCQRQMDLRRYIHSRVKRRQNNRNRNNNQASLISVDAAECIDDDIEFEAGLRVLLAKGSLVLSDDDAQMLNSMNTFDRLQYFQTLAANVK